jgi:large conductance mechanosensitive channel
LAGVNFKDLAILLKPAVMAADGTTVVTPDVLLKYGAFLQTVIDFLIVAWCVFLLIKVINSLRRKAERAEKAEKAEKAS